MIHYRKSPTTEFLRDSAKGTTRGSTKGAKKEDSTVEKKADTMIENIEKPEELLVFTGDTALAKKSRGNGEDEEGGMDSINMDIIRIIIPKTSQKQKNRTTQTINPITDQSPMNENI